MKKLAKLALVLWLGTAANALAQGAPATGVEAILDEGLVTKVVLIVDTSGSMNAPPKRGGGQNKIVIARQASGEFLQSLAGDVEIGVIVFDGCQARWAAELGKTTRQQALDMTGQLAARGSTPIYKALVLAGQSLVPAVRENPYTRAVAVLLTDGEETCDGLQQVEKVSEVLAKGMVELNVIGFDLPGEISYLKKIGARYFGAEDSGELRKGLASVQAEMAIGGVDVIGGQ